MFTTITFSHILHHSISESYGPVNNLDLICNF